jgi:iron complex outermembrane receptor protein
MHSKTRWRLIQVFLIILCCNRLHAQNMVSGQVTDALTGKPMTGVSISVQHTIAGTTTDAAGKFSLTVKKFPATLVFSYVGYELQEQQVSANQPLAIQLKEQVIPGQEVVVSASKIKEHLLQSPVSIEKLNALQLKAAPGYDFFQAIGYLKGVDMVQSSINYPIFNARGFNATGNSRMIQLLDGMDVQIPGLNLSAANVFGPTELDIDNMEFLPGAASALYGPNAFNGAILQTTKNPFQYQGLSVYTKYGINHITDSDLDAADKGKTGPGSPQSLYEVAIRYAHAFNNRFAFKINAAISQATDWYGTNFRDRAATNKPAGFSFNPGADQVFGAGDEVASSLGLIRLQLAGSPVFQNSPLFPLLKFLPDHVVSRTPYEEFQFVDYDVRNFKLNAALHYRINDKLELSYSFNYGNANTILNAAQRTPISDYELHQHKVELKSDHFFVRAYATLPQSNQAFSGDLTGVLLNNSWKPHAQWFQEYSLAYLTYLATHGGEPEFDPNAVAVQEAAHQAARVVADKRRLMPGTQAFGDTLQKITSQVIPKGSRIREKTALYHVEAQYDLSRFIKWISLQVGASYRLFDLNSNGTLFADSAGNNITVREVGAYAQASKKIFNNKLKLTGSIRYDKNENFDAQFSPRVSAVFSPVVYHNFRVAWQTGFRIPTLQGQHTDFNATSMRILGGLPQYAQAHKAYENAWLLSSVQAFTSAVIKEGNLQALGKPANLDLLIPVQGFDPVTPEKVRSIEIGYKGLLGSKLFIDVAWYYNRYKDFIAQRAIRKSAAPIDQDAVEFTPQNAAAAQSLLSPVVTPGKENTFSIYTNVDKEISAQGFVAGLEYNLPRHFTIGASYNWNQLNEELGDGFMSEYNTPRNKVTVMFGNRRLTDHIGFNLAFRWQSAFLWESNFAKGEVPAFGVMDAQVSYTLPRLHSTIKLGGSDIFNKRYIPNFGAPTLGAVYYLSLRFDDLLH